MNSLAALVIRNIARRRGRAALTASGVALGVAMFFGALVGNATSTDAVGKMLAGSGTGLDVVVSPVGAWAATLPSTTVDEVRSLRDVDAAIGLFGFGTTLESDAGVQLMLQINRPSPAIVAGIDSTNARLLAFTLSSGAVYSSGTGEALVPRKLATRLRVRAGSNLTISTPTGNHAMRITGILADSGAGRYSQGDVVFTSLATARRLAGRADGVSRVLVDLREGTDASKWARSARTALGDGINVESVAGAVAFARRQFTAESQSLTAMAGAMLFTAGFLIYLTLTTAVAERVRAIGTLYALGATKRQIRRLVLGEASVIAAAGTAVGLPLGVGVAYGLGAVSARALANVRAASPVIRVGDVIAALVLGLGTTLLFAIVPARRAAALDPAVAMRGDYAASDRLSRLWIGGAAALVIGTALTTGRPNLLQMVIAAPLLLLGAVWLVPPLLRPVARWVGVATSRIGRGVGDVAVLHLAKERTRSAYTLALVMIVMGLTIAVGAVADSFTTSIERQIDREFGADLVLTAASTFDTKFVDIVRTTSDVKAVSVGANADTVILGHGAPQPALMDLFDPRSDFNSHYAWRDGDPRKALDALATGDAVIFPARTASRLHLKVGASVTLDTALGPRSFRIAGTAEVGRRSPTIGMSLTDGAKYFRVTAPRNVAVKLAPGANASAVTSAIQQRTAGRASYLVRTLADAKADVRAQIAGGLNGFYVLVLIAGVVGLLGLANTIAVAMIERYREIGVLRAIGARGSQIRRMALVESATLTTVAFALAVPLGSLLSVPLVRFSEALIGDLSIHYSYPWRSLPVIALGGLVVSTIAAIAPARRAVRLDVVDALRFE